MAQYTFIDSGSSWTPNDLITNQDGIQARISETSLNRMDDTRLAAIGLQRVVVPVPPAPTAAQIKVTQLATPLNGFQFEAMLRTANQYDAAVTAITAWGSPDNAIGMAWLTRASNFARNGQYVNRLFTALSIAKADADNMWITALGINLP